MSAPRLGGRYRCERHIGAGASGTVWAAVDELLDREVAVKALHRDYAHDEAYRTRFLREARILAGIRHPSVVRVLDFAAPEDGVPFMVMEMAEGRSLAARLERGRPSPQEAIALVLALLRGLSSVHEAGVVHRDVKPDNILLGFDGAPLLIDFGISNLNDAERSVGTTTQEGIVRGTPQYMAPEQARGLPLDRRADLYSVAVILYELLSDELPHSGRTAADLIVAVASEAAVPLSQRCPDLSPVLTEVVARGLEREPADRWQTAEAFADALTQVLGSGELGAANLEEGEVQAAAIEAMPASVRPPSPLAETLEVPKAEEASAPPDEPAALEEALDAEDAAAIRAGGAPWIPVASTVLVVLAIAGTLGWYVRTTSAAPESASRSQDVGSLVAVDETLATPEPTSDREAAALVEPSESPVNQPELSEPELSEPEPGAAEARAPETRAPEEARAPEAHAPEAHAPEAHAPEAHAPEAHAPEAHAPEAPAPEASAPEPPEEAPPAEGSATTAPREPTAPRPAELAPDEPAEAPETESPSRRGPAAVVRDPGF